MKEAEPDIETAGLLLSDANTLSDGRAPVKEAEAVAPTDLVEAP